MKAWPNHSRSRFPNGHAKLSPDQLESAVRYGALEFMRQKVGSAALTKTPDH